MIRVVFDEIHFLLETVRFSVDSKTRGRFPNYPNLVIWEAKRIRFQNTDRLVDCSDQQDAMIVSVESLYETYLGGRCLSA